MQTIKINLSCIGQEMEEMEEEAAKILQFIGTDKCKDYLRGIVTEEISCSRHNEYMKVGMLISGLGPFTLFSELVRKQTQYICEFKKHPSNRGFFTWHILLGRSR